MTRAHATATPWPLLGGAVGAVATRHSDEAVGPVGAPVGDASRGAEQACHPGAGDGGGQHSVAATRTALYLRIISVSFCGVTGHLPVHHRSCGLARAEPSDVTPHTPHITPTSGARSQIRRSRALAAASIVWKSGAMGGHARVCPRCGARFDLPPGQRPVMGVTSTAGSAAVGSRTVSLRVDDVLVHQCQQRVDPITGEKDWRPARTVGADPPS